ncbi:hypothetical protein VPHD528_0214 [Vibrio phage D528]
MPQSCLSTQPVKSCTATHSTHSDTRSGALCTIYKPLNTSYNR